MLSIWWATLLPESYALRRSSVWILIPSLKVSLNSVPKITQVFTNRLHSTARTQDQLESLAEEQQEVLAAETESELSAEQEPPRRLIYTDYESVFDMVPTGAASGDDPDESTHVRFLSPLSWIGTGSNVFILELAMNGHVRVSLNEGECCSDSSLNSRRESWLSRTVLRRFCRVGGSFLSSTASSLLCSLRKATTSPLECLPRSSPPGRRSPRPVHSNAQAASRHPPQRRVALRPCFRVASGSHTRQASEAHRRGTI